MWNKIREFFKNLLSANGKVSSKRVVGFGSFLLFAAEVIVHLATHIAIQEEVLWATVALVAACFGLNTMIDIKAMSSKSQVASDIIKNDPNAENADMAQEVLQNPKP